MSEFILAYTGGSGMPETEEEGAKVMAAWGAWYEQLGAAIVDGGAPTGAAKTIAPDGAVTDGSVAGLTGYTVLSADSLDEAAALAKGCPILAAGGSIDVYEKIDM